MPKCKTHLEFLEQSNIIHNNKYSYPQTYVKDNVKILIKCPIHELFEQKGGSHLRGHGCSKCADDFRASVFKRSYEEFKEKAIIKHKNKYIYLGEYKNARTCILIKCPVHGNFMQTPDKHLQGNGCPKCAGKTRKTKEEFINESMIVHNDKYSYPGKYVNARTDIEIKCIKHGIFLQNPDAHLNGSGCPSCSSNTSKPEMRWLDSLNIPNDNVHRHCRLYIGNSYIKPDGFDSKTNTIYEFYGDYYHGNPRIHNSELINHKNNKTFGELYKKTLEREELIRRAGYKLVTIWENDWRNLNG